MFDFFRKKAEPGEKPPTRPGASDNAQVSGNWRIEAARLGELKSAIESQKKTDPLIGPKIGAAEVNTLLINGLTNEKNIHIESFLTVLGSLAGFSCQMSLREKLSKGTGTESERIVWMTADGADGKKYHFGDALNKPLAEDQYSIWSLAAGVVEHLGAPVPDVREIYKHVAETVGCDSFGIPRIPENHRALDLPLNYVKVFWPKLFPVVTQFCDKPSEWPILFGLAIQEAIVMAKDIVAPCMALTIVMESAIPMSKVDLPDFYPPSNSSSPEFKQP